MIMTLKIEKYYKKTIVNVKKTYLLIGKENRFSRKVRNTFTKKDLEECYLFFLSSNGDLIKVTFENELTKAFFFEEYRENKIVNYSFFKFEQAKMAIAQKLAK